MPDPATFPQAKAATGELLAAATALDKAITGETTKVALGYEDYTVAGTRDALLRAQTLLAKDHYKVCFAGGFSCGKSTTINALLGDADLLPTAAGECTLAITVMSGPYAGRECVRIKYFTREMALRNVVRNQKRYRNAFKLFDAKLKGESAEAMIAVVRELIDEMPKIPANDQHPEPLRQEFNRNVVGKYVAELQEFLACLETFAGRCGTIHEDQLSNRNTYLTYDDKQGGLGHLFMIDQVFIHKRNVLFEEKAIQVVDLPGIDSTNSYARQVSLNYLKEADLVICVLPPQGFTMSYLDLIQEFRNTSAGNIANKVFCVINRFDANEARNYEKKEIESLLRDQVATEIDRQGLDRRRFYATCALLDIHKLRGHQDRYEAMLNDCRIKIQAMGGNVDEPWRTITTRALSGEGITVLRADILKYLERELAFERLRDVAALAKTVTDAATALLARNSVLLQQARAKRTSAIGEMRGFILKTQQAFEINLTGLANGLPVTINQVIQTVLKPQVAALVGQLKKVPLADPAMQIKFTGAAAKVQNPLMIQQLWIDFTKQDFSDRFTAAVHQTLVGNVQGMIDTQVAASKVGQILEALSQSSAIDLAGPLKQSILVAKQNVDVVTRLRADEETWRLRREPIHPQGYIPAWTPAVEEAFKNDLVTNFTKAYSGFADSLGQVLGQYYQVVIRTLIADFKARAGELENALMNLADLNLPLHLLTDEAPDPEEIKRKRLLIYSELSDRAAAGTAKLKPLLAN
jgi:hypothetical protein